MTYRDTVTDRHNVTDKTDNKTEGCGQTNRWTDQYVDGERDRQSNRCIDGQNI
jgi:hypothetical protein